MTTYDLTLPAGEDLAFTVTVYDSTGVVINLSTYTAKMQFKDPKDLTTAVIDLSETSGLTLGSGGTVAVAIAVADIAALTITEGVYDLVIDSGTAKTLVLGGSWIVERAISQ